MEVFRESWRETLVDSMVPAVKKLLAAEKGAPSSDEVRSFLLREIATARRHGIQSVSLIRRYLTLAARCGQALTAVPWGGAILADPFLGPADKILELERHARTPLE